MTDGGDTPHGMDGEENVGGVSRYHNQLSSPLVPLIEDLEEDSPIKQSQYEEFKENHDGKIRIKKEQ